MTWICQFAADSVILKIRYASYISLHVLGKRFDLMIDQGCLKPIPNYGAICIISED